VFSMQLGFAMLCAGCVRRKNISNTLLKNLLDACGAALAYFAVGFAFSFGGDDPANGVTFAGTTSFFLVNFDQYAFWFFQYAFSAAAVTIIAGTLAERCRMSAYVSYSLLMSGFVYPIVVHSIWSANGFLSHFSENPLFGVGVVDYAGSGVIHLTGGSTALIATWILGARKGRFVDEDNSCSNTGNSDYCDAPSRPSRKKKTKVKEILGHSISLQVMGTLM